MKKYILLIIMCGLCIKSVNAQEFIEIRRRYLPVQDVSKITSKWEDTERSVFHTIEYKTQEGNDATLRLEDAPGSGFRFYGGAKKIHNPITGKDSYEENQDLYIWMENLDTYSAAVGVFFSENMLSELLFGVNYGYCISKKPHPELSDNILYTDWWNGEFRYNYTYNEDGYSLDRKFYSCNYNLQEIQNLLDAGEDCTLSVLLNGEYASGEFWLFPSLKNLEYMTTYYIRPYMIIGVDSIVMYGGEKSFTTPKTIEGALDNEEAIGKWHYYDSAMGVVLTNKAMLQITGYTSRPDNQAEDAGIAQDLRIFLTDERLAQLKSNSNNNIECVDGMLYLVDDVPIEMVTAFQEFLYSSYIEANLLQCLNQDVDDWSGSPLYTKNVGEINFIECDESWGVPYNSCVEFVPTSSSTNPYIAINIPKYLFPRTYSIYAVFVHPEDDTRGYRFYTYMWEKQTDDGGNFVYPSSGTRLVPPEGAGLSEGNYYMTNPQNRVDTLYIGDYTFNGAPNSMIQFYTQITSRQAAEYNRAMRIAQIYLVPTEEEETKQ